MGVWVGICKIVVRSLYAVFTQTVYDGLFRRKETESCRLVSVDPYRQLSSIRAIDPSIPRSFLQQIIDHIVVNDGRVISITFKNGSTHTFTYKT